MIRLIRTATLNRLRDELADAQQDAEFERIDAALASVELFEAKEKFADELADARQEATTYSDLAGERFEQLLTQAAKADTGFEGLRVVIKQVTGERDEAREQLRDARQALAADREEELAAATADADRVVAEFEAMRAAIENAGVNGDSFRARLALHVLRNLIASQIEQFPDAPETSRFRVLDKLLNPAPGPAPAVAAEERR